MSDATTAFENHGCKCPKCGETERIDVVASMFVRLTKDGSDADLSHNGDQDWDGDSPARCDRCGHNAPYAKFLPDD